MLKDQRIYVTISFAVEHEWNRKERYANEYQ